MQAAPRGAEVRACRQLRSRCWSLSRSVPERCSKWSWRFSRSCRIAGVACLIWLGLCLIRKARAPGCGTNDQALPETAWGVASFQLLNPKSWILVVTAISALGGTPVGIVALAVTFVAVMGLRLAI